MNENHNKIDFSSIPKELTDAINLACSKNIFDESVNQLTTFFNAEKDALILHSLQLIGVDTSDTKLLSEHGMIKIQPDNTHEFYWKGEILCSIRLDVSRGVSIITLPNHIVVNPNFVGKIDIV
jgi:hypothetical protein